MLSRNIQALTPSFLKKIDQYLLVNRPNLWATKIHHFAFWGSLYFLLLNAIAWFYPMATNSVPSPETAFVILVITGFSFFIYWVYQLMLFKVEDKFGLNSAKNRLQSRMIYALSILFLAFSPYYYTYILKSRIEGLASNKMIMKDLENIKNLHSLIDLGLVLDFNAEIFSISGPHFLGESDEKTYEETLPISDSVYREIIVDTEGNRVFSEAEIKAIVHEGVKSYNKYSPYHIEEENHNKFSQLDPYSIMRACENNIHTILEAQHNRPLFHERDFSGFYTWFVFSLILLLSIFLTVELSTFIMAVVTAFVSLMGLAIFMQFLNAMLHGNSDALVFLIYMLIITFFTTLAYSSRNTKRFAIIRQISLILLSTGISFLPLIINFTLLNTSNRGDKQAIFWLMIGITFALGMWNMFFAAKMRNLCTSPQQN